MFNWLDKKLNYIAQKYFGLEGYQEVAEKPSCADLSDELIYQSFDEQEGVFRLREGWLGYLMEVSPIVGITETLDRNMEQFFADELPFGSYLQFTLIASHKITPVLDKWLAFRTSTDRALQKFAQERYEFLQRTAGDFTSSIQVRDYRVFISFMQKASLENFASRISRISKKLQSLELAPIACSAQDLVDVVHEIAVPSRSIDNVALKYETAHDLRKSCLPIGNPFVVKKDELAHKNGLATKIFQVAEYPENFSLQAMINLLGDEMRETLSIPARMVISFCIAANVRDPAAVMARGKAVILSSEKGYSRHDTNLQREAGEWVGIIDTLRQKGKLFTTSFLVAITTESNKMSEAESALTSLYNINSWELVATNCLQLPTLMAMLPMQGGYYFPFLQKFNLTRSALSSEILSTTPVHAEWKGVARPGMLLLGRRGQLLDWNPFYRISSGNYNVVVFGPSGSGKSVFLQELTTCMLAQGVKVFILDIGLSFKNICSLLGGEMVQFSSEMDISLNPFGKIAEQDGGAATEAIACLQSVISSMCGAEDKAEEAQVERAIVGSISKYGKDANITTIASELDSLGTIEAKRMAMALFPYTVSGKYGKYFDRASNIHFSKPVTVFEFEEIRNDRRLLSVVLQIISMQIFLQVLSGDRQSEFMLVVDEAWMVLDHCAKLLADLARTIRKYGGSLVTCVQSYDDFQKTDERRTIFQNSTWAVMLKQDEKDLNSFKSSEAFKDMIPLIRSVQFKPGRFSEALIYTSGVRVVGRMVLDKYSQALFSTDAKDFNFISKRLALGQDMSSIVDALIQSKEQAAGR